MGWEPHRLEIIEELTQYPLEKVNTKEKQDKIQKEWDSYIKRTTELKETRYTKLLNNFITKIHWNLQMTPFDNYKAAEHYIIRETPIRQIAIPYQKHLEAGENETYVLLKISYIG